MSDAKKLLKEAEAARERAITVRANRLDDLEKLRKKMVDMVMSADLEDYMYSDFAEQILNLTQYLNNN